MSPPSPVDHVQTPTTAESMTSTVVGSTFRTLPTGGGGGDAKIDGFPSNTRTYEFGLDNQGVLQESIDGETLCPPVIPPTHAHRTLVVCFDGTGDQFDNDNSNIVQLVNLMKKDDRHQQLVYYQAGIGTYTSSHSNPIMSSIKKTLDTMIALSLKAHVIGGYEFLMQNYIAGDKICLFGFSRGAYTARSLAGMLHKVGLLPAGNFQQVPFAYKMYKRADDVGWEQSTEFKNAFCVDVPIEFIGVWDTVDSVGLFPRRLPFTTSNTIVRTFRHAVSLDERRAKFKANLWNRPSKEEEKLGQVTTVVPHEDKFDESSEAEGSKKSKRKASPKKENQRDRHMSTMERLYSQSEDRQTDILEVWFAGCHCDVGGGSVSNKTRHSLARISLRWMIRECFKTNTGILFLSNKLHDVGLDPTTLYPQVLPRPPPLSVKDHKIPDHPATPIPIQIHKYLMKKHHPEVHQRLLENAVPFLGSEEEEEVRDAVSPRYDQLHLKRPWWILEILPMQLRYQHANDQWITEWKPNMGGARYIPQQRTSGFKVHRSVRMRMEAEYENEKKRREGKRYEPRPTWRAEPIFVD